MDASLPAWNGHHQNAGSAEMQKDEGPGVGVIYVGERLIVVLFDDQEPARVLHPGLTGDLAWPLAPLGISQAFQRPDAGFLVIRLHGICGFLHDGAVHARAGLEDAFRVQQVDLAGLADAHIFH